MTQTMKQEIDHRLSFNSDRSKWIVAAIRTKLNQEDESADALSKAPMADLLIEMMSRTYHPAFKSMFTKGDAERIDLWKEKARKLPESGE